MIGSMQCGVEIDIPQALAAYSHACLGHSRNSDGHHPELGWLLCRPIYPRYD